MVPGYRYRYVLAGSERRERHAMAPVPAASMIDIKLSMRSFVGFVAKVCSCARAAATQGPHTHAHRPRAVHVRCTWCAARCRTRVHVYTCTSSPTWCTCPGPPLSISPLLGTALLHAPPFAIPYVYVYLEAGSERSSERWLEAGKETGGWYSADQLVYRSSG